MGIKQHYKYYEHCKVSAEMYPTKCELMRREANPSCMDCKFDFITRPVILEIPMHIYAIIKREADFDGLPVDEAMTRQIIKCAEVYNAAANATH